MEPLVNDLMTAMRKGDHPVAVRGDGPLRGVSAGYQGERDGPPAGTGTAVGTPAAVRRGGRAFDRRLRRGRVAAPVLDAGRIARLRVERVPGGESFPSVGFVESEVYVVGVVSV